jgi:hypothetical protein
MPNQPKDNKEFFQQWHDFLIEDAEHKVVVSMTQKQQQKDIEGLQKEAEKNKKIRYAVGGLSLLAVLSGIWTSIKILFGVQ